MRIRLATVEDAGAIAAIYAPFVTDTAISFELEPPDAGVMAARIAAKMPGFPWLVAEEAGAVIGYAYAGSHRVRAAYAWSTDVSVYLADGVRRRGIATKLYRELLDLLRLQGYRRAYAGIALPNQASVGFHERVGFTPVGVYQNVGWKFGRWHDVGWWQLALSDDSPATPLKTLEELDQWPDIL